MYYLFHWGWVMHICISKLTTIGSDNGLSPGRRQAIICTNAGILLIRIPGTNFSEIHIEIHTFSFKKMHLNMSSGKWRPFWLGLNVLKLLIIPVAQALRWGFLHTERDFMVFPLMNVMSGHHCLQEVSSIFTREPVKCDQMWGFLNFPFSKLGWHSTKMLTMKLWLTR